MSAPHGADMFDITGYDKIADREGLVIAYPDGEGATPWNVGDAICGLGSFVAATGDDQSFMDEIIKLIEADQCVDHDHISITGFSMGGYLRTVRPTVRWRCARSTSPRVVRAS
jgi:polyhydroxybutyrate depolymerase